MKLISVTQLVPTINIYDKSVNIMKIISIVIGVIGQIGHNNAMQ